MRALLALPSLDIAACDNQGNNAVVLARRNGRAELADEIQELVRVLGHALRCPLTLSTNTPLLVVAVCLVWCLPSRAKGACAAPLSRVDCFCRSVLTLPLTILVPASSPPAVA